MSEAAVVVAACALASLLCMLNLKRRDRRIWGAVATVSALFGAYKHWQGQAFLVGHVQAAARSAGWYGERHGAQWIGAGMVIAAGIAAAVYLATRASMATPARAALALALLLLIYAMLGAISAHRWDRLVSTAVAGVAAYTLIEVALPLLIGLCALLALFGSRRHRAR